MSTRGKVIFVSPAAYPLGGVATWLDYLIDGLKRAGWDARVALTAGTFHDVDAYCRSWSLGDVITLSSPTGTRQGRVRAIARMLENQSPDIVLGVNIVDVYAATGQLRRHGDTRTRVAATLHGIQPDFLEDISGHRALLDAVICTNRLTCELVQSECGMAKERVLYAPYGVSCPPGGLIRPPVNGRLVLAYVGRFDSFQKRVEDMAAILSALDYRGLDYQLLLAGSGPSEPSLRASLEPWVKRGKASFLGALSAQELQQQVYARAHALLITSSWETGPIVAWEAMAHRVAVVTSEYVGFGLENSLASTKNCLTFPVGNWKEAADAICALQDRALLAQLVRGGFDLIEARYNRERSIAAWNDCLDTMLAREPSRDCGSRQIVEPAGRLDRFLGASGAETVRRFLGLHYSHREPGGEWPHSYGLRGQTDANFWQLARRLDQRVQEGSNGS